jgi:creatinine amidohydrolase/Fe(II)-dependent formamide hydrolase-like protein
MNTSSAAPLFQGPQRLLVLQPIGTCEQHGPHMPINTDLRIAELIASQLEKAVSDMKTLLLPTLPYSASWEHKGLGTIALNVGTLAAILHDIAKSLYAWNTPLLLLLVNWHGGNDVLASLATEISATEKIPTAVIPSTAYIGRSWSQSNITTANDVHAGAVELSVIQAYWPDLVPVSLPESAHYEPSIAPAKTQSVLQALGSYAVTESGIWGAPEQANPEKGRMLIEGLVQDVHQQIRALFALVDRVFQERE